MTTTATIPAHLIETRSAQCTRCGLATERQLPVEGDESDTDTTLLALAECPRCGHDRVLTASIREAE